MYVCKVEGISCEHATELGFCKVTGCTKRVTIANTSNVVTVMQLHELTDKCIERIADAVVRKIKEQGAP